MPETMSNNCALNLRILIGCVLLLLVASPARGQTTVFTYQGRLSDSGAPANGAYDLQFKLFDTASTGAGTQIGSTITNSAVTVTGGVFTTQLDFGAGAFPGADRFLEISVRLAGSGSFTVLSPRQPVTSTPYAIRSASATAADTASTATNATQLGGVAAGQYVLTSDSRLSDPRPPTAGSSNYIQNATAQQAGSNFNISGNGTAGGTLSANTVTATTQYNIGGVRVLRAPGPSNLFVGILAGIANTSGSSNSFFGSQAGIANTIGFGNTFVGDRAGSSNTGGIENTFVGASAGQNSNCNSNSFFGYFAGASNTTGCANDFFGASAGASNTTGINNAFFGGGAGFSNTNGGLNSFFGSGAGLSNTTGDDNAFFGTSAGSSNTTGAGNTLIGSGTDVGANNLTNATAIGANAKVNASNTMVLGTNSVTVQVPGNLNVSGTFSGTVAANSLSGVVPTANGGTGLSAPGTNGNFLRSNGSAWTSAPLSTSDVPGGSVNYIQNGTAQQASSNFNISGNGTAGGTLSSDVVNAATQYNIGGNRVLMTVPASGNLFLGVSTGAANTTGAGNSFFGNAAGKSNSTGQTNSFFGAGAGSNNTTGNSNAFFGTGAGNINDIASGNSFFGKSAGEHNTSGSQNSFVGMLSGQGNTAGINNSFLGAVAGFSNTTGSGNSFFGDSAGVNNTTASENSFFGDFAGPQNTTGQENAFFGANNGSSNTAGNRNSFFGSQAGSSNTTENNNTFIGASSNGAVGITNASAIGFRASVTQSNSLVLGSINSVNGAAADVNVGIGTTAPNAKLQVTSGDMFVQTQGRGIILRATDGANCYRVTVNNSGALTTTLVTCP